VAAVLGPAQQEPAAAQSPGAAASLQTTPIAEEPAASSATAEAAIDAGLKAFKRRRFTQAEAEFSKAVQADPRSAAAHFYLAYTYYKMVEPKRPFHPDKQKAAAVFAKAYELDPGFRPVWVQRRK
jgi:Tfp pilus assembly protein PilF